MDVEIMTGAGASCDDLRNLRSWLIDEPEFRGRVTLCESSPHAGEMGVETASMVVGLAASGSGLALASASVRTLGSVVITWLKARTNPVDITMRRSDGTQVTLRAAEVKGLPADEVRRMVDNLTAQLTPPSPGPAGQPSPVTG